MLNDKDNKLGGFWSKMSHIQRGNLTCTKVTSIKIMWLFFSVERYRETGWIDVAADVHVEVGHIKEFEVTVENKCYMYWCD
jgi:hypothetical protein